MSNQDHKRSRNDARRQHVEKRTGEKHKHRIQEQKINEADEAIKQYFTEDHPFADD